MDVNYFLIEKAKAKFNTARAKRLEEITEQGKNTKADVDKFTAQRDEFAKKCEELLAKKQDCENAVVRAGAFIVEMERNFADELNVELEEIDLRIAEAEKKAQNGTEDVQSSISPIQEQIEAEKAKLEEINKALASKDIALRQKTRIAELEADEKRLAVEYGNLDKIAFLIDKFTKFKVDLLSEEINSHFQYAKFKLFDEQINMGISECCEATVNGVPYSDLNTAARINAGLDIINTLSSAKGKTAPVFLDNRESCTSVLPTQSQVINLFVSASDKKLRIEKA